MKTKKLIGIGILVCLGFVLLMAMPFEDGTNGEFVMGLITTKAAAVGCFHIAIRTIYRMERRGEITIEEE